MRPRIRLLVLDVDGVITDGSVLLLPSGDEARSIKFRDLDAVTRIRNRGLPVAILSGEDSASSRRVATRFGINDAVWGAKDKLAGLKILADRFGIGVEETCYVGDADRDAPALEAAGFAIAPADASQAARDAADHVLVEAAGQHAVGAAIDVLERCCELLTLDGTS